MLPKPERRLAFRPAAFCVALLFGLAAQNFIEAAENPVEASITHLINVLIMRGFRDAMTTYEQHFSWQVMVPWAGIGVMFAAIGLFLGRRLLRQR